MKKTSLIGCLAISALIALNLTTIQATELKTSPVYAILLNVDTPEINPGETVSIDVYINGNVPIPTHKFTGHVPQGIVDGPLDIAYFLVASSNGAPFRPVFPRVTNSMSFLFGAQFSEAYFTQSEASPDTLLSEASNFRNGFDRPMPPVSIYFKTRKDAPPGPHKITLRFWYPTPTGSALAEAIGIVTISSFGQRYQNILMTIIAVMLTFAGLIPEKYRRVGWSIGAGLLVILVWMLTI